ncbi:MAG: PilZ domain-containing protein [Acidobacteriota bacterium]|nr:PilZ domain-containing protein [Acidobacteriota bacterium]
MEKHRRGRERRTSPRLPLGVPIFARGLDENGKEFLEFTTTLNISAGGVLLGLRRYLPVDTTIALEIPAAPLPRLPARPTLVRTIQARVVRVLHIDQAYLSALSFSNPISPI